MRSSLLFATVFLFASGPAAIGQENSLPVDDAAAGAATAEVTDAEADAAADAANALADVSGPLAFGVVYSNGAKQSGTGNWSSTYNATYKRYEIGIDSESYYYTNYSTVITPAGDTRFCRSSSVSGKLLVYCYDSNGVGQTARFGFVTFKP